MEQEIIIKQLQEFSVIMEAKAMKIRKLLRLKKRPTDGLPELK